MKSKSFTYLMLVAVAIIWYMAFGRLKGNLFAEEVQIVTPNQPTISFSSTTRDTFVLNTKYRDPFGETKKASNQINEYDYGNNSQRPVAIEAPPVTFQWPSVQYLGMVKKTQSSNPLAIITIDGFQLMGRQNEELFDRLFLKKIYRDSVLITYKGKKKFFLRY